MIRLFIVMLFFSMSSMASATTSYTEINEETITQTSNDNLAERMIRFLSRKIVLTDKQKQEITELAEKLFPNQGANPQDYRKRVRQFKQTVRYFILTPEQRAQW